MRAPATPRQVDDATAKQHAQQLAGSYQSTRREDSTFFSLLPLLSPLKVQALDDGRVALELAGSRSVFREVKPYLWEEEHGKRRLQAIVENGRVLRWGLEPMSSPSCSSRCRRCQAGWRCCWSGSRW